MPNLGDVVHLYVTDLWHLIIQLFRTYNVVVLFPYIDDNELLLERVGQPDCYTGTQFAAYNPLTTSQTSPPFSIATFA